MVSRSQTSSKITFPELLAPAGSPDAFRAAIAAGADAVYLSGKRFGARKYAQNFTDQEINDAVRFAHTRDVRIYVTVNTLVHDHELPDVAEYLLWLYSIGVDAVLVQDIGVAGLAHEIVPELPLHASTQMTIINADGVRWAAEQGFARVVLARELPLSEVEAIARETEQYGIGLEVFAHGALCYSYSGQCLLSSVIGGRSGNRGICAQPCRKPYILVIGDSDEYGRPINLEDLPFADHYLLSPRDLCTYLHLPELVRSSIVSLKIEGRMRSPEYVAITVSVYRQALDAIASGAWKPKAQETQNLLLAFNRGFTNGYLFGAAHDKLMGRERPDNRGIFLGKVIRYERDAKRMLLKRNTPVILSKGDGLVVCNPNRPEDSVGFFLNTLPVHNKDTLIIQVPRSIEPGFDVYLTSSLSLKAQAKKIMNMPTTDFRRPMVIDLSVTVGVDGRMLFKGLIEAGRGKAIKVLHTPEYQLIPSKDHPLTKEQFAHQLRKTGGMPFFFRTLSLMYDGSLFAPIAELNQMRREFLIKAQEALISAQRPSASAVTRARERWTRIASGCTTEKKPISQRHLSAPFRLALCADRLEVVEAAAMAGCDVIYFEPPFTTNRCRCRKIKETDSLESQILSAHTICHNTGVRLVWKFPRITRMSFLDASLTLMPSLIRQGITECMVENMGTACALIRRAPELIQIGSIGFNIFNHRAVQQVSQIFPLLLLSPELSRDDIRSLIQATDAQRLSTSFSLIVQGCIEAMISEDCILKTQIDCKEEKQRDLSGKKFFGIRDNTGRIFPVRIDGECRTHISNSAELCLLDHLPSLMQIGVSEVVIDARGRTGAYAAEMSCIYRTAIAGLQGGDKDGGRCLELLKKKVKRIAMGGITTGHFLRGQKE